MCINEGHKKTGGAVALLPFFDMLSQRCVTTHERWRRSENLKKEWTNGKRTKGTFRVKCEKYKDFISPVPWNPSTRTKRFYKLLFILHKAKHWKKKGEIVQHIYLNIWLTIFVTLPSSSNDLWAKANFMAYKINQQTHL